MNSPRIRLIAALVGGLSLGTVLAPAQAGFAPPVVGDVRFTAPEPAMVVAPMNIPLRYRNETVRLRLAIDERGRVTHVRLLQGRDRGLERHLLPVVARWHFKPAMRDGRPVPADVVLPLELVESADR